MEAINKRINWLEKHIAYLRSIRGIGGAAYESELIINICEYQEELDNLLKIKSENSSLFR